MRATPSGIWGSSMKHTQHHIARTLPVARAPPRPSGHPRIPPLMVAIEPTRAYRAAPVLRSPASPLLTLPLACTPPSGHPPESIWAHGSSFITPLPATLLLLPPAASHSLSQASAASAQAATAGGHPSCPLSGPHGVRLLGGGQPSRGAAQGAAGGDAAGAGGAGASGASHRRQAGCFGVQCGGQ